MENLSNPNPLTTEISFKEIALGVNSWFKYLLSKWPIILAAMIIGGGYKFWEANSKPLKYIASSSFFLQESGGSPVPQSSFSAILGIDGQGIFQGDNLFELYRSNRMIKKALLSKAPGENEYLIDKYLKINGFRLLWKDDPLLKNINFTTQSASKKYTRAQDSLLKIFVNDINFNYLAVFRVGQLSIFRVEVRSPNEEFAKLFNDQIVKTVNQFYVETKLGQSLTNLQLLQHQVDSIQRALNRDMYRTAASADITINANPARQVLRLGSQRSQVSADNNKAMLNELVRNLELSKMSLQKETPLIKIIDAPFYPLDQYRDSRAKALISAVLVIAIYSIILLYRKVLES
jgi:hypothetical protein